MKRCLVLLLCLLALSPTARAAEEKYVALTFDDGPSGRFTRRLLEGLEAREANVTFFVCGYRLQEYPALAAQLLEDGHELGIHGYSHGDMRPMSRREIAKEIMDTEALLPEGCEVHFMRPPGGFITDGVRQVAEARTYAIAQWSVDPRDWATKDAAAVEGAVLGTVKDGDIILLHDTSASSVKAALDIVDTLHSQGYELVTVSELAYLRHIPLKGGKVYKRFAKKENE